MGKPSMKKKSFGGKNASADTRTSMSTSKNIKSGNGGQKFPDVDGLVFISVANELKEEGNKLFQKRDYERAFLKYEKAIKLLPKNHSDVSHLRSNLATCYMLMGPPDYYRAINECNLALEVSPKYTKALLKRARCFEALERLDLACRDVDKVLYLEPNSLTALEISERVKGGMLEKGIELHDKSVLSMTLDPEVRAMKKTSRKKSKKSVVDVISKEDKMSELVVVVAEEKHSDDAKENLAKPMKLMFGEDIRVAQIPMNCGMLQLRDIVHSKFPGLKSVLIKYKDKEGDLITITSGDELRWAEESADPHGSVRLYIMEVNPEHEHTFDDLEIASSVRVLDRGYNSLSESGSVKYIDKRSTATCIDDWIVQFAHLFKNHVGISADACLDIHELGMKLYSEAIEDTVTSEEAQEVFQLAEEKFQEMVAIALFNWGNVHMARARKRLFLSGGGSKESLVAEVKIAYEWAREKYLLAGKQYEQAMQIKPDFFEALLALGQQQFEQAKLSWYYAIGCNVNLETWDSSEVLEVFNNAEDNMEKGTAMWEESEARRLNDLMKPNRVNLLLHEMGLEEYIQEVSMDEAAEAASNIRSQINILWGMILYERSVVEFKLELPMWGECLMAAIEKFKLAGTSSTDIAVMIKNHCANETALEGLGFKIDEIIQARNEIFVVKRWIRGVPSFRLEPLFKRRFPKLHQELENVSSFSRSNSQI